MKKLFATILTLTLLLMSCAIAEEIPAINWADAESAASDIAGTWYVFNDIALEYWVPDIFENKELTEEDGEEMLAKHELPDGTAGIYAQYLTGYDGATMDETVATLEANGATEIERCTLNGLDAVSFSVPDVNEDFLNKRDGCAFFLGRADFYFIAKRLHNRKAEPCPFIGQ